MKITYLDHSGFAVEQGETLLVFDEYNPRPALGKAGLAGGVVTEADVRAHARSALFLSHSHSDHYCREVLALPFGETVLSGDFPASIPGRRAQEGESFSVLGLPVRAFGSTDLGLSYLVEVDGRRVFHAGDFNLWHWEDESTPQEIAEATEGFERILADLADCAAGTIDLAFFPLDPRMGKHTDRGAVRFLKALRPKVLVPMHLQGDAALAERFAAQHPQVRTLTQRGQTLEID